MNRLPIPVHTFADSASLTLQMQDSGVFGMALGLIIAISVVSLAFTALWIYTLVQSAKREQWVWFVLILVFGPVCLIYLLAGPHDPPPPRQFRSRRTG